MDLMNAEDFVNKLNEQDSNKRQNWNLRLVRHYTSLGAIPKPEKMGKEAFYSEEHLLKAKEITQARAEGVSIHKVYGKEYTSSASSNVQLNDLVTPALPQSSLANGISVMSVSHLGGNNVGLSFQDQDIYQVQAKGLLDSWSNDKLEHARSSVKGFISSRSSTPQPQSFSNYNAKIEPSSSISAVSICKYVLEEGLEISATSEKIQQAEQLVKLWENQKK